MKIIQTVFVSTVMAILVFTVFMGVKDTPVKPEGIVPLSHPTFIKDWVEQGLKVPRADIQFYNIPAKDVPTVACDSTYTNVWKGHDGKKFSTVVYVDDHEPGFDPNGRNVTEVEIYIGDAREE